MQESRYEVQGIRQLTASAYAVRLNRNGLDFRAGQHITLGLINEVECREYSIYSGEQDDYIEVLVKTVENGNISKKLKQVQPGDLLNFDGPVGYFTLDDNDIENNRRFIFIGSGTGIAPFRSFVKSYPGLNYTLLHGVRYAHEAYDRQDYHPESHILCTSRDKKGDFNGRITQYLKENIHDTSAQYYLCGNINMIYEAFDLLQLKGVPSNQLHAEVYF
jgi:ferredoxin--NADP+ reductase/benzoate/toluate 1,2-dioxygenase reductase subunit